MNFKRKKNNKLNTFEQKIRDYKKKGYNYKYQTISIKKANFYSIFLIIPICTLLFFLYYEANSFFKYDYKFFSLLLTLFIILVGVVLHEGLHGFFWGVFAQKKWKSIKLGVEWKTLTPYCTCEDPMKMNRYIIGAIMPFILLGIIPWIFSMILANELLLIVSEVMVAGAGGDILIIVNMILRKKEVGKNAIYLDHPSECGSVAIYKVES